MTLLTASREPGRHRNAPPSSFSSFSLNLVFPFTACFGPSCTVLFCKEAGHSRVSKLFVSYAWSKPVLTITNFMFTGMLSLVGGRMADTIKIFSFPIRRYDVSSLIYTVFSYWKTLTIPYIWKHHDHPCDILFCFYCYYELIFLSSKYLPLLSIKEIK